MSGVAIIRLRLVSSAAVLAVVPAERIMAGEITLNTPMPAISIKQVFGEPYLTVANDASTRLHTERVQVTAMLKGTQATPVGQGYPGVKALLKLVLAACSSVRGTLGGFNVDSIVPDIEGPDLSNEEVALYSQSRDFIVKYNG